MTLRASGHRDFGSLFDPFAEPAHVAVQTRLDEVGQVFAGLGPQVRFAKADRVEAEGQGARADLFGRCGFSGTA